MYKAAGKPTGHGLTAGNLSSGRGDKVFDPLAGVPLRVVVLDTAYNHSGTTSQVIDTQGVWDHYPIRQVTGYGSVTPGRTYRLRAWVRSKGNTNPNSYYVIGIWWFYNDGKVGEKLNAKQPTTSYDWRLLTIEAKATAKANRLAAFLSAHYHGVVWYDDIEVRERKTPP